MGRKHMLFINSNSNTLATNTNSQPFSTTEKMTTFYANASNCRGGIEYGNKSYVVRLNEQMIGRDNNIDETESLLVKQGDACNLENIKIRAKNGKSYTSVKDYLADYGVNPRFNFWSFIEVMVDDYWVSGNEFYMLTQPSADAPQEPFPFPEPFDESRPPRQNACSVVPGDSNYHDDEDNDDEEVAGETILPSLDTDMSGPVPRAFTDYPGMDEEFRIRFRPVDGVHIPGTWSGNGVIFRHGYFENPITKHGYHEYEIRLDHMAQSTNPDLNYTQSLYSVAEFAEIGLGHKVSNVDAWSRIEVNIDGRWTLGTFAAKKLFNIEVQENQRGVLSEFRGLNREY